MGMYALCTLIFDSGSEDASSCVPGPAGREGGGGVGAMRTAW